MNNLTLLRVAMSRISGPITAFALLAPALLVAAVTPSTLFGDHMVLQRGDAKNIHPADKAPICERLALLARRDVHLEQISGEGPVFKSFAVKGNRMVIEFTHGAGLKTTDGKAPTGFWLSNKDGSWQQATASIVEDNKVTLEAAGMESPVACRYAFAGKPPVNLVNRDNLPAYPFRTDDWAK